MTGKTHLIGGVLTGAVAMSIALDHGLPFQPVGSVPFLGIPCALGAAAIGGLFPDIDWHTSKIGSAIWPVSRFVNFLFGHRTLFHAPILYVLIFALLNSSHPELYWFTGPFVLGAASHIVLDMMNKKGVSLLYPTPRRFHILSLESGGIGERIIRSVLLVVMVAALCALAVKTTLRFF